MKEKILVALKTKCKSFGFNERTLVGVACYLSQTITEEKEIETAVHRVDGLLRAFQGEMDRIRTENSILKKQLEKVSACDSGTDTLKEQINATETLPVWSKQISDTLTVMEEQLQIMQREIKQSAVQTASPYYVMLPIQNVHLPFTVPSPANEK